MPARSRKNFSFFALGALCAITLFSGIANAAELVMFRSESCPWCAKWDREIGPIYPKTEFSRRAPLRTVCIECDSKPAFSHEPIHYTPTFVLVEDSKEVGRIEGYPGDEFFWFRLERLLAQLPPVEPPASAPKPQGVAAPSLVVPHGAPRDRRL